MRLGSISCGVLAAFGCVVGALAAVKSAPPRADAGIVRATLANGMRVIIVRNTLAPVVATSVNYLVGSDEAPDGFPGTAHAQEHMMFRGSPGLSADQLADIGSIMGGSFNADTREGVTQYYYTVPTDDLDVALNIEAARMNGVDDSQKEWDLERGAIEQEVAQDLSNPEYVVYEKLRAALFAGTPYEHDALGTRPSFDKTTSAMLQNFYDQWYAPNNAILVVAGDLDPQATLAKIKTLFGGIKRKTLPQRPAIAPKSVTPDTISVDTDRPTGTDMIAMRVPGIDSPDFPALEVLADVVSSKRGALYGLVPDGKALETDFALDPLPHGGMMYAEASFAPGDDPKALDSEVREILKKTMRDGISPALVQAAKDKEKRQNEFQKNSIEGLASVWSEAVAVYGLNSPDDDLARIEKVTVADVNRVARKYIDLDHAISAVMTPQGSGRPTASGGFGGQENIALGEAVPTKLPDWAERALTEPTVPQATTHPVVTRLANGLTLIVQPENVSDTISVYGHIKNRPEMEVPRGQEGLSRVIDELFSYGSEKLDRLAFQSALDDIGADESAGTDFSLAVLTKNFNRGVALLADNELHPALPQDAMEVVRMQTAAITASQLKSPGYLTQRALREALFPKDDPSLHDATPETVNALTLADIRAYYKSAFRPDLATIVVIGKITPEAARATIEKYFGTWSATGPTPATDLPPAPPNKASAFAIPDAARVQDNVTVAETFALTRSDPDYYALRLGNAVLGGGFYSTRFSIDLRKNSGLVYSVSSNLNTGKTRSVYTVSYACDPENVSKAASAIVGELKNMQTTPVGSEELARVRALLIRQIPLSEASVDAIARGFETRRDLDLPLDEPTLAAQRYIALTPADIQKVFQKWVRPDDLVRVSQGPEPR